MNYNARLRRRIIFGIGGVGLLIAVVFVLIQFQATLVFTVFLYYTSRPIYRKLDNFSLPSRLKGHYLP
jgi:predicted PurR-regulated permease PerM